MALVIGVAIPVGLLFWFDPVSHSFYPRCLFHQMTGLLCPGCGSLRATHQLLHGNFGAAWQLNPLLFIIFLWLAGLGILRRAEKIRGRTMLPMFQHPLWIWALVGLIIGFAVARNLPGLRFEI